MEHFNLARQKHHIGRGLESIGETRFATIYWAAESIRRGLPALRDIVRDKNLNIEIGVCSPLTLIMRAPADAYLVGDCSL